MTKVLLLFIALFALGAGDLVLRAQRQGGGGPLPGSGVVTPGRPGGQGAGRQGGQGGGRQGGQGRDGGPARAPRDRAEAVGTAVIRGRVVAAESGAPLRGVRVEAAGNRRQPRAALTDGDGRFEIRDLPAGPVTLRASKSGYVTQQFGQRSPFSPSTPVVLADGQPFTAEFALLRGGVISGRVFDEFGDPVANVRVSAVRTEMTMTGRRITSAGGRGDTTDDTGAFRLFGLAPGIYYVSATLQSPDRLVGPQGAVTYVPTFFPGTTDLAAAQRVPVSAGFDQHNIDFALVATPAVQVSGVVIGGGGVPIAANVTLRPAIGDLVGENRRTSSNATDGTFTTPNVPPGNYVLDVTGRARSRDVPAEVASVPLTVGVSGMTGLTVTTTRGAAVSGAIVTDDGSRLDMTGISVSATPLYPLPGRGATRAQPDAAGTFTIAGIAGAHTLRIGQLPSGWILKSVIVNGVDATDRPLEFRGTEQASVRVVLTNRVAALSGVVRSEAPRGAAVLVFPEDETRWLPQSRLVRVVHAGPEGQFSVDNLPRDERFVAVALDYVENGEQFDPDFLARVRPLARGVAFTQTEPAYVELALQGRP